MSQTQRQNVDLLFKAMVTVLLGMSSFFLVRTFNKMETTYESVIRLEEKVNTIEKKLGL